MSAENQPLHLPDAVDIVLSGVAEDMRISREEIVTLALHSYIKAARAIDPKAIASLKDGKKAMHDNAWDMAWFAFMSEVEEAELRQRLAIPNKQPVWMAQKNTPPGGSPDAALSLFDEAELAELDSHASDQNANGTHGNRS